MADSDSSTMWQSTGTGALSGAGTGAAIGSAIAPGVGTAVGAGVGAVAGGILGFMSGKSQISAEDEADKQAKRAERLRRGAERKAEIAQRRSDKQLTEQRSRAGKEGRDLPEPRMSGEDVVLAGGIALGPGTPYDNYLSATYGRKTQA